VWVDIKRTELTLCPTVVLITKRYIKKFSYIFSCTNEIKDVFIKKNNDITNGVASLKEVMNSKVQYVKSLPLSNFLKIILSINITFRKLHFF